MVINVGQYRKIADYFNTKWQKKTQKTGKHSDLETIVYDWFALDRSLNIPITERILIEKGQQIGDQLQITGFAYSFGWISNFKKCFGINSKILCGESGSSNVSVVASGTEAARAAMKDFSLKDVFNCDETGLFYRMLPSKSLTVSGSAQATKKVKDRITILLCTNADGSNKMKP